MTISQTQDTGTSAMLEERLRVAMDRRKQQHVADLRRLIRIPSVSTGAANERALATSAAAVAEMLDGVGLAASIVELDGAPPYVIATGPSDPSRPTVLLYAHHDVHGVSEGWESDPFEPYETEGRLYGRGAADDKAGLMAHVAAIQAWQDVTGGLPVNIKVLVEGEEEAGSPHLPIFLERHAADLDADVVVIADVVNWDVGWPAITVGLRGLLDFDVTVRTADRDLHSGIWGGAIPDAMTALIRLVDTLHDENGNVAVGGLDAKDVLLGHATNITDLGLADDELESRSGALDSLEWLAPTATEALLRTWTHPAITVAGVNASSGEPSFHVMPAEAKASVSLRTPPGFPADRAVALMEEHLYSQAPWGAVVTIERTGGGPGYAATPDGLGLEVLRGALEDAFEHPVATIGCGGSIPFVELLRQKTGAEPVLVGVEDPHTNAHGSNESVDLKDFGSVCLAEALFLGRLAEGLTPS